jgi:hypothetical protein
LLALGTLTLTLTLTLTPRPMVPCVARVRSEFGARATQRIEVHIVAGREASVHDAISVVAEPMVRVAGREASVRATNNMPFGCPTLTVCHHTSCRNTEGPVHVGIGLSVPNQHVPCSFVDRIFTREGAVGSHSCSLQALACG